MKKFRHALAVSIFLPLIAHASIPGTSKISIPGGAIGPNQDIEILFKGLLESVVYQVNCNITSDSKSKQETNYIALYSGDNHLQPSINGKPVNQYWQAKISAKESSLLSLNNVTSGSASFIIRNLDDADTLTVNNCYALPQV